MPTGYRERLELQKEPNTSRSNAKYPRDHRSDSARGESGRHGQETPRDSPGTLAGPGGRGGAGERVRCTAHGGGGRNGTLAQDANAPAERRRAARRKWGGDPRPEFGRFSAPCCCRSAARSGATAWEATPRPPAPPAPRARCRIAVSSTNSASRGRTWCRAMGPCPSGPTRGMLFQVQIKFE